MPLSTYLLLLLTHPNEFRTLVQYKLYYEPSRDLPNDPASGWERESMRTCWRFLDLTSRSFAAVIKELEGELARTICLFYLVLRALDTIEDDMTLPDAKKQPILRSFHQHTVTPGWSFTESGPNEKDRALLVEYPDVVTELLLLPADQRDAILSIAQKMGAGMADFAVRPIGTTVDTQDEYDLYCHYVAGLVGEGLSLLFAASGKESPSIAGQLVLSNSLGLFLQKTNITRDLREDADERRYFYPRAFWGPYGFSTPSDMCPPTFDEKDVPEQALWVQSAMVVDALRHATDGLEYLRLLKNQSVFNFCAIPATMAMATLDLCFMNRAVFVKNVKIRKAAAANLIMRSTNPREVSLIFREYARKIHARALPHDPNFMKLSVACGKIEQWHEHAYPSFVVLGSGGNGMSVKQTDPRGAVFVASEKAEADMIRRRQLEKIRERIEGKGITIPVNADSDDAGREVLRYAALILIAFVLSGAGLVYAIMRYARD
ncbi:isoprenoid synthase domain-containing protein [Mycena amicta]|nr:isoprenoid synthase domain-containing protein [Mycena amicta]